MLTTNVQPRPTTIRAPSKKSCGELAIMVHHRGSMNPKNEKSPICTGAPMLPGWGVAGDVHDPVPLITRRFLKTAVGEQMLPTMLAEQPPVARHCSAAPAS